MYVYYILYMNIYVYMYVYYILYINIYIFIVYYIYTYIYIGVSTSSPPPRPIVHRPSWQTARYSLLPLINMSK